MHILLWSFSERGDPMQPGADPKADLDDLIFEEDDGGPSER